VRIIDPEWATELLSYMLGPLGLLLMGWAWFRLRYTRYRHMAVLLLSIILLYAIAFATMWLWGAYISLEERHFRYAGILFFLLLLTAVDQSRARLARGLACVVVIVLGLYGLKNSVTGAYAHVGYYDPMTGLSQPIVSATILEYMRSERTRHNFQRPIAVVTSMPTAISKGPFLVASISAGIGLPRFRIITGYGETPGWFAAHPWAGRAEKIFVVVPEQMLPNGMAEAMLRSFTDYEFKVWKPMKLDGMVIYTQ
jgi:hypothetical protein